ncbi:MAG TPA: threonine--tRNA ligase [Atribacteraceae bacterium]|nr:threonine--tRNA ligase [Atribacteraceae bacterium]
MAPKNALAAITKDGQVVDLDRSTEDTVAWVTFEEERGKEIYWHTTSHVMAQAVKRLFPDAKVTIGPAIEQGFYYDFDVPRPFTEEDLAKITLVMKDIIRENIPIKRLEMSREEAVKIFREQEEDYKVELIEEIPDATVSLYRQGEFIDLCRGPHLPSTGTIKAFKLLKVSGAYWRGREDNPMLQRIYGISFDSKDKLKEYLHFLEEARKRDHRKLGRELGLFSLHEEGPGFPFFHPKGMVVINTLLELWRREHTRQGYLEIKTPIVLDRSLWERSGHWDHYRDNMYFTRIDNRDFAVKPMNCPGGILVYQSRLHSYREFPLRIAELGLVHRHELSGVLHGLMRVRCFTQDDAHIYMEPQQATREILNVIRLAEHLYRLFDFQYEVELSTRPEHSMGTDETWELATRSLVDALTQAELPYRMNEGDGAFYGPKIDFHLKDSLGRRWQCGTIQLDFSMPEKFDLNYIAEDGAKHRPVMVHRTILGSIERFLGILIEHYAGAFPVWLSPVQVVVLPVAERHLEHAFALSRRIREAGIRVDSNPENATLGSKIRKAQLEKIPYVLVVGDRETETGEVSVRDRREGDLGNMTVETFVDIVFKHYPQPLGQN